MSRRLVPILALALLALPGVAGTAAASPEPRALTLRLVDLPAGYSIMPFGPCESDPALAETPSFGDRGCRLEFGRAWTAPGATPGPAVVGNVVAIFTSASRAQAAFARPRELASLAFDPHRDSFEVVEPTPSIGDEAVLLRGEDGSATVIWRSGAVVAAVLAGSGLRRAADVPLETAVALAEAQQRRIAAPTPLRRVDNDWSRVAIDDPGLELPVWWLGDELSRHGALPALRFGFSMPPESSDGLEFGPYLSYGRPGARAGVVLTLARRDVVRRRAIREELRRLRRDRCTRVSRLPLPSGRATIFWRLQSCPRLDPMKTPEAFDDANALALLPGVAVFVSADTCTNCRGPVSRYESEAGMRRIVRALRLRPEPFEQPPAASPSPPPTG